MCLFKKKKTIHFRQHIPGCCSDCKPEEYDAHSLKEILEKEKRFLENTDGRKLIWASGSEPNYLLVSSTTDKWWWVVGYVDGINLSKHLPHFEDCFKGE